MLPSMACPSGCGMSPGNKDVLFQSLNSDHPESCSGNGSLIMVRPQNDMASVRIEGPGQAQNIMVGATDTQRRHQDGPIVRPAGHRESRKREYTQNHKDHSQHDW